MTQLAQLVVVNSVADMRQLDVSQFADGQVITLRRYWPDHDSGGGLFGYSPESGQADGGMVFTPASGPGRFTRLDMSERGVDAAWFGAIGDRTSHPLTERFGSLAEAQSVYPEATSLGQEIDRVAIQAALDHALQHTGFEVHLADGNFVLDDTLHIGYGNGFHSVALIGAGLYYGTAGTCLTATFQDRPAIAIQGARYSAVRNLAVHAVDFDATVQKFASPTAAQLTDPRSWVDDTLLADAPNADSRHAPYAGIAIDPYSGPAPTDAYPPVSYPSWIPQNQRTQYHKDFSSGVQIENVEIGGFVVGIVNQPCDADGNGDFTKIHKCLLEYLKYAVSIGNSQSRNVSIRDCTYNCVHTFLTNNKHGRMTGKLGGPVDNVSGGSSYQFSDIYLNQSGPLRFSNLYFEAQIKFGVVGTNAAGNAPVTFDSCEFGLGTAEFGYNPDWFISTSAIATILFSGCVFSYYGKFLNLANEGCRITLDSCTVVGEVFEPNVTYTDAEATAQNYLCGGLFCLDRPELHGAINSVTLPSKNAYLYTPTVSASTLPHARAVVHQGATGVSHYPGNTSVPITVRKSVGLFGKGSGSQDMTGVNLTGATLTFTALRQNAYQQAICPGDLLFDWDSQSLFIIQDVTPTGTATAQVHATIATNFHTSNSDVLPNAPASQITDTPGTMTLTPCSVFNAKLDYRGTTTRGTNTITEVTPPAAYAPALADDFIVGDLLFHTDELWGRSPVFPAVTRITAVDPVNRTITVDQSALGNVTGYPLSVGHTTAGPV